MKIRKGNSYPFIILFVIHAFLLFFTFNKKRDKKGLFILLFSNVGFAYLFEYFVLNLFKGYKYKPKILKESYLDNIFGAILSQAIFVPFTSVFITAFQLGWKAKIAFGLYFACIERLFLKLRVFKNYWWKTTYTLVLIPIYFIISDKWYEYLKRNNPKVLFISLFNLIMVTGVNILYVMAVLIKFKFGIGKYPTWREHFMIAPLYSISLSLVSAWQVRKDSWTSAVKVLSFSVVLDWCIKKLKLIKSNSFSIGKNLIIHLIMIYTSIKYKKLIYNEKETSKR